jgi:opacity protein-like surface antigen
MRRLSISLFVAAAAIPGTAIAGPQVYGSVGVNGVSTSDIDTVIYTPAGGIYGGGSATSNGEATVQSVTPAPSGSDTLEGTWNTDTSAGVNGAIGLDFGPVRAEAEVSYVKSKVSGFTFARATSGFGGNTTDINDISSDACLYFGDPSCSVSGNTINFNGGNLRQLAAMGNVWIDLPIGGQLEPYVGGGLGMIGLESDGEAESAFAWQVGGGVAYKLSGNLALTADVRHRESSEIEIDFGGGEGVNFGKVKSTTYGVGLRLSF